MTSGLYPPFTVTVIRCTPPASSAVCARRGAKKNQPRPPRTATAPMMTAMLATLTTVSLGPDQPGDGVGGLPDLRVGAAAALGDRLRDAVRQMLLEQAQGYRLQRPRGGGDLREDVDAVFIVLDHALQPPDLAFDPAQPRQVLLLALAVSVHAVLPPAAGQVSTVPPHGISVDQQTCHQCLIRALSSRPPPAEALRAG